MIKSSSREAVNQFADQVAEVAGRSLWQDARRRFMRNKAAMISLIILLLMTLFILVGGQFSSYSFDEPDWASMGTEPSLENGHYFGTDTLGRDLYVRTLLGGKYRSWWGIRCISSRFNWHTLWRCFWFSGR